jgi:hypothetical protein
MMRKGGVGGMLGRGRTMAKGVILWWIHGWIVLLEKEL